MTREFKIDGTDRSSVIQPGSWELPTAANRGEVAVGRIVIEDSTGTLAVPAWKELRVLETAEAAQWERIFTGYVVNKSFEPMGAGTERRITVETADLNHRLDEAILRSQNAIRDRETDVARITWLATTAQLGFLTTTAIQAASTVMMDARSYRDGTPLDVLNDCAEAAGKNFFLAYDLTSLYTLFYGKTNWTSALFTGAYRISDDPADQAGGVTLYPINPRRSLDATQVYSGVNVGWDKGTDFVTSPSTESTYKQREINIDSDARTSDGATNIGTSFLDQADAEEETVSCSLLLDDSICGQFRAGNRVEVKLRFAGITSFTWMRIIHSTIRMAANGDKDSSPNQYMVDLEFQPRTVSSRPIRVKPRRPVLNDQSIPNGSFENGPKDTDNRINDWNVVTGTAQARQISGTGTSASPKGHGGIRSLRCDQTTACQVWTEDFAPVQGFRNYIIRAYHMYTGSFLAYPSVRVRWYDSSFTQVSSEYVALWKPPQTVDKWNRVAFVTRAPKTAVYRKVYISNPIGTPGQWSFFDDISLEPTDLKVGASVPPD